MSCGGTTGSAQPVYISSLPPCFLNGVRSLSTAAMKRQLLLGVGEIACPSRSSGSPSSDRGTGSSVKKPTRIGSMRIDDVLRASSRSALSPKPSLPRGQPVKICSPVRGFFDAVVHLCAASTCAGVRQVGSSAPRHEQLGRIEMAAPRIVDDAVLQHRRCASHASTADLRQQRELRRRHDRLAVGVVRGDPRVEEGERLPDAVVRRIAGDDAVVVLGIALRFGERLVSARRAADEVGVLGEPALRVADDQLRRFRSSRGSIGTPSRSTFSGWPWPNFMSSPACPVSVLATA